MSAPPTSSPLDRSHDELVTALQENLWSLWTRFGRGEGCRLYEDGQVTYFDTPILRAPYNTVLRFEVEDSADERIDRILAHYKQREITPVWLVHPTSKPVDLVQRLEARGLVEAELCPGMCMDLANLPDAGPGPDGVEVYEATGPEHVRETLELAAWRWEVPEAVRPALSNFTRAFGVGEPGNSVRCWLARMNGIPVSKVLINLDHGAAGLYGVATKPEARGKGLARHLTLLGFAAAREAGYRLGVLHSTPVALSLYQKLGFQEVAPFRVFAAPQSLHM